MSYLVAPGYYTCILHVYSTCVYYMHVYITRVQLEILLDVEKKLFSRDDIVLKNN